MPTYDYECDACHHKFELFQSITEEPQRKCPQCKKMKLRRLFGTGAAIMFKGSGFYTTDYRSEAYKKAAGAESGNGEKKDSPKSETATSSKTESSKSDGSAKESPSKSKKKEK